ncbi:NADH dehydrogenase [ubiquinone] 1 alpha subcomplex assembly factor 3-like isoform X1 [Paramacrobiotus metropolitanus]|uniref:NADH dehydrogenase [ubiquinone] 1 alpha subcomplex assembly factor 3-like isoform X1 n=1 Tax=Paramacrobiotus metropolitanus TaxID=2943436 RepID=UPI0024462F2D|nr:NADH dehydrogenase [ubiquinone] 1 alpha subcomplex assembly factor 3-like isoform X1 [Paramacrobiotus metropolitanus]
MLLVNCRKLLLSAGSICGRCVTRSSSSWEYKGEEYDPNKKIIPFMPKISQQYDPEVDTASKTTVTLLNKDLHGEGILMVDSVSPIGFKLNNSMHVLGPMALFSKTVFQWKVADIDDIAPEAFSLFYMLEPKLDILVVGYGDKDRDVNSALLKTLVSRKRMGIELLPTEHAIATFNFLVAEGRHVAGAFIPPESLQYSEADMYEKFQFHNIDRSEPDLDFSDPITKLRKKMKKKKK